MMPVDNEIKQKEYFRKKYQKYYTWIGPIVNEPKTRAYSLLALTLMTIAFFVMFAIRPTLSTIVNLRKQIEDDRIVEQKLQEKINALSKIQTELEIIKPDLPFLNTALPTKSNIIEIIKSVEKITADNQASLSAVQIQGVNLSDDVVIQSKQNAADASSAQTEKKVIAVPILFTVEGDYQNLSKIAARVRKLPRILSVQNLIMLKNVGSITSTIRVFAYYLP